MEPIMRRSSLFVVLAAVLINVNELLASAGPHDMDKRQPIPMPRIGRSASPSAAAGDPMAASSSYYYSNKRQSLIPAPRIGRRSAELGPAAAAGAGSGTGQSTSMSDDDDNGMMILSPEATANTYSSNARSVDCPELCDGYELAGANNEDLVEPLDIQLRAAFIPRLGKRSARTQDTGAAAAQESDDLVDIYRPGTIGGKVFGFLSRQQLQQQQQQQQPSLFEQDDSVADTMDESEMQRLVMFRNWLTQNMATAAAGSGNKRAALYTPRIGRAVFAPRIGKKAAFVPRIG